MGHKVTGAGVVVVEKVVRGVNKTRLEAKQLTLRCSSHGVGPACSEVVNPHGRWDLVAVTSDCLYGIELKPLRADQDTEL